MAEITDDGSAFAEVLGVFGSHANPKKRAQAERLAGMKPGDPRRKPATRTAQFNVRVDTGTMSLMKALIEKLSARDGKKLSQADLVILAIAELAKAEKVKGTP